MAPGLININAWRFYTCAHILALIIKHGRKSESKIDLLRYPQTLN